MTAKLLPIVFVLGCLDVSVEPQFDAENRVVLGQHQCAGALAYKIKQRYGWELDVKPTVYWTTDPIIYRGEMYYGLTYSCDEIYVWEKGPVKTTALEHELKHCFRLHEVGDGDATHSDLGYWEL